MCGALVHGAATQRWGVFTSDEERTARLHTTEVRFEDWQPTEVPTEMPLNERSMATSRRYESVSTKRSAIVSFISGIPGSVATHTPDVCYPASGYKTLRGVRKETFKLPNGRECTIYVADFEKKTQTKFDRVRVRWAWLHEGVGGPGQPAVAVRRSAPRPDALQGVHRDAAGRGRRRRGARGRRDDEGVRDDDVGAVRRGVRLVQRQRQLPRSGLNTGQRWGLSAATLVFARGSHLMAQRVSPLSPVRMSSRSAVRTPARKLPRIRLAPGGLLAVPPVSPGERVKAVADFAARASDAHPGDAGARRVRGTRADHVARPRDLHAERWSAAAGACSRSTRSARCGTTAKS